MAHDHEHGADACRPGGGAAGGAGGKDGAADGGAADIRAALGLPGALPPIRLPRLPELAALAAAAPLPGQLAALAEWVGKDGRAVDEDGDLTPAGLAGAAGALGADAAELAVLWDYALAVDWLAFDDYEDRVLPGETAAGWWSGEDEGVFAAWSNTLVAVLDETLERYGPGPGSGPGAAGEPAGEPEFDFAGPADEPEFDFAGQGVAMAILLFLARREGLTAAEFADALWESAAGIGERPGRDELAELARARAEWEASYGDPARLLLGRLAGANAITEADGAVRLSPLALAALREQLIEAGVDIPLLPPTAAELTGAELLAMAEGVSDAEFEAEADAWTAARGAEAAARELLGLAAGAEPGDRMLAVATVTRIGAPARPAWRDSLATAGLGSYAKVALLSLDGPGAGQQEDAEPPADLALGPADLAWMATDLLALACDDDYPDPDELAASFGEAVPPGHEGALFEAMAAGAHPAAAEVLAHLGRHHPDRQLAKAARSAAHKAASRRGPRG